MKLGISTYTYNWALGMSGYPAPTNPMTATMLLDRATDLGAEVVQFCNGIPLHTFSRDALSSLRAEAGSRGLVIELGTAGLEPDRLRQYIDVAQRVGATFIRTLTHSPGLDPTIEEANESLVAGQPCTLTDWVSTSTRGPRPRPIADRDPDVSRRAGTLACDRGTTSRADRWRR